MTIEVREASIGYVLNVKIHNVRDSSREATSIAAVFGNRLPALYAGSLTLLVPFRSRRAQASACAARDRRSREIAHAEACALLATARIAGHELASPNRIVRLQAIHVGVRAGWRPAEHSANAHLLP